MIKQTVRLTPGEAQMLFKELDNLRAAKIAFKTSLAVYGDHRDGCRAKGRDEARISECTCGFVRALGIGQGGS